MIEVVKNNKFAIVDETIIIAYKTQITEVIEYHNKTVPRQSSS